MAILARLAFHTPVGLDDVSYEGITEIRPDDIAYAKELGLSLKLLGIAERLAEGISVRVFPCFLYRGHPLAPVEGPFNAVTFEAPAITEITISGPGAGGIETASAVLADVVSILGGEAPPHHAEETARDRHRRRVVLLPPPRGRRPPARARRDRRRARQPRDLGQERRPAGTGTDARLVMVTHRAPETTFYAALEEISDLDFMRAPAARDPRVEEESMTAELPRARV